MLSRLRVFTFFSALVVLFALMLSFGVQQSQAQIFGAGWTANYYPNTSLSGTPSLSRVESAVNYVYGTAAPNYIPGFPADNWSATWESTQQFTAGTYRFTARYDDGARVYLDGVLIINNFTANNTLIETTAEVALTEGAHTIRVEYVEFTGESAIQFFWESITGGTAGPTFTPTNTGLPPIPAGALTATVIRAGVLNVRDAPSLGGGVISRILRGQTYQVVGRNADATWFLLQLNEFQGWAFGYYLFVNGNEFTAPVRSATTVFGLPEGFTDTGVLVQTNAGMRMRAEPNVLSPQTGRITWGAFLPVAGRTAGGDWFLVLWKGTTGWVYTGYLDIVQGSYEDIPVIR